MSGLGLKRLAGLAALLLAGPAAAAPPPIQITLRWAGDTPANVVVMADADVQNLAQLSPGQFEGRFDLTDKAADVDVEIGYADGRQFTLPLYLTAGTPKVALAVRRPTQVRCVVQVLDRISAPAASIFDAVENYLTAKAINGITGNDKCGPALKARAAKVWFETSYQLVTKNRFFRIDPGAHSAYAALDPVRANYYVRQASAAHVGAMYQQSVLLASSDAAAALAVNKDIQALFEESPELARAAETLQGVSVEKLQTDQQFFATMVGPQF